MQSCITLKGTVMRIKMITVLKTGERMKILEAQVSYLQGRLQMETEKRADAEDALHRLYQNMMIANMAKAIGSSMEVT
jgi:hypothetical protein